MANDAGIPGFGGAIIAILGVWSIVGIGVYVWYLWALARLFPLIGLPAAHGWIPVWNQWRLIERGGLPGWLAVFMLIPGLNIIAYVASIIAIHRINTEHGEGAGMTVLGAFVAPLWATLLGTRIQDRGYAAGQRPGRYAAGAGLVEYGPDGQVYPLLRPEGAPAPTPTQGQFTMPPVPRTFATPDGQAPVSAPGQQAGGSPAAPVAPVAPVAPAVAAPGGLPVAPPRLPRSTHAPVVPPVAPPAAAPAQPAVPSTGAQGATEGEPGYEANPWGFGKTTEGNFLRLAGEELPARDPGFGAGQDLRPFSWPEPAPAAPAEPPAAPVPAQAAPPAPAAPVEPAAPVVSVVADEEPAATPAVPLPDFWDEHLAPDAGADEAAPSTLTEESLELDPAGLPFAPAQPVGAAELPASEAVDPAPVVVDPVPVAVDPVPVAVDPVPVAVDPVPVAVDPAPAVPAPAPVASPVAPPSAAELLGLTDDDLDSTVVVTRAALWVLELPGGQLHELQGDDIVLGRKPVAVDGSEVLVVQDPTRTLSKSHARLRRQGDGWTIEDLHSTNGVFMTNEAGEQVELQAGVPAPVVGELLIGTLPATLRLAE